jgi:hypothetical protein
MYKNALALKSALSCSLLKGAVLNQGYRHEEKNDEASELGIRIGTFAGGQPKRASTGR